MPRYDLAAMTRRAKPGMRKRSIVLRDIDPPGTLATNLYRGSYFPVVQAWSAAAERIIAAYAATVSEMTTDAPADVRAEIDGAAEQINRLVLLLTPEVRDWALRTEQWFRGKWRGAVLSATGVDLETMIGAGDVRASLETSIEWNVALVKDVSDVTRQKISNAVFDGLRNRTPAREVAKTIRDSVGMSRSRATRIASDQLNKLTSALADERRREAGIDTWIWRHSRKAHPRLNHQARDGKEYTDETAPQDLPGRLPYCGCRSQAVISFD
jgi:SPP1 gp7 family putative phage head morphogenesis protein